MDKRVREKGRVGRVVVDVSAYLAAAASQGSSSDGMVLAAEIAAIAAFVAALVAAVSSVYTAKKQNEYQRKQSERDYAQRQLQELYGPLRMLRDHSKELRAKVGPQGQDLTDPAGWRLVEHIEEIPPGSPQYAMVETIISINNRISKLLEEKGGLSVELPQPASFGKFLAHAGLLAESWKAHKNQQGDDRAVFPRDFDDDINGAIKTLRQRLGVKAGVLANSRLDGFG